MQSISEVVSADSTSGQKHLVHKVQKLRNTVTVLHSLQSCSSMQSISDCASGFDIRAEAPCVELLHHRHSTAEPALLAHLAELDAGEQQMARQEAGVALQQVCYLAHGHRMMSCQMMGFSQQQVRFCHTWAVLQQHLQKPALAMISAMETRAYTCVKNLDRILCVYTAPAIISAMEQEHTPV